MVRGVGQAIRQVRVDVTDVLVETADVTCPRQPINCNQFFCVQFNTKIDYNKQYPSRLRNHLKKKKI